MFLIGLLLCTLIELPNPQISGFGNLKSSYGQFELFAGIITVLVILGKDVLIKTWPICVAYF